MFWQKVRGGVAVTISILTCPCHLPVTVPLMLALLAGTPIAAWLIQHVGWVYGVMAGVFILSFGLACLWTNPLKENTGEVCEPHPGRAIQAASASKEYNR